MTDHRYPKQLRLVRRGDFQRVFDERCSAADGLVIVYGVPNELGHARLGVTVSRRVGGAVARNRWKRCLREAFRLAQHELPALDLVCLPQNGAEPDVGQLVDSLPALARRIDRRLGQRSRSSENLPRSEP